MQEQKEFKETYPCINETLTKFLEFVDLHIIYIQFMFHITHVSITCSLHN